MSRTLRTLIFKKLDRAAKLKGRDSLLRQTNRFREQLQPSQYGSLITVYYEVFKKRCGAKNWSGKSNLRELGYNCAINSKGFELDLAFAVEWLKLHSDEINRSTDITFEVQELILREDYAAALKKVEAFQELNGWTFWALETFYFLVNRLSGTSGVRAFTKYVKEKAGGRVVGYAASMFADRVDDRYSVDAYMSRWKESINKTLKSEKAKHYYEFRGLGLMTDAEKSLGHVICNDFSNSLIDCYSSVVEAISSVAFIEQCKDFAPAMLSAIDQLKSAGVTDYRLTKLRFFISGDQEGFEVSPYNYPLSKTLVSALYSCQSDDFRFGFGKSKVQESEISSIADILDNGAPSSEYFNKLRKYAHSLRFCSMGLALQDFAKQLIKRDPFSINIQPWISLLSPELRIEDFFGLDYRSVRVIENEAARNFLNDPLEIAKKVFLAYESPSEFTTHDSFSPQIIFWLACEFLKSRRDAECAVCIDYLSKVSRYWSRQACKLRIQLLCMNGGLVEVVDLAYSIIELNPTSAWEYPLDQIFESYEWSELKSVDTVIIAIVSHFTNAMLGNTNEDVLYVCKMACKKIHESFERENFFNGLSVAGSFDEMSFDSEDKKIKALITLYAYVWIEKNLVFLDFSTSREVMQERLEVLRLLVQLNPENEQRYANAIMDITLRDTMWEGLAHIEETRIFVNEAGITRWAEKEIRSDFDNWKLTYIYESKKTLINKMVQYVTSTTSETVEEFIDYELSEDCRLFLNMVDRLQQKFMYDPVDGLHCYLSARIRHGTMKNTYLGPIDEAGLLAVDGQFDESIYRFIEAIDQSQYIQIVKPALINLSVSLSALIDDVLDNKIRLKSEGQLDGYIEIKTDEEFFSRVGDIVTTKLDFHQFLALSYDLYWDSLWPSLQRLAEYFDDEMQGKTNALFEQAIEQIDLVGEESRALSGALTRIKNATCQKCLVAARWFKAENHRKDQIFTLSETISIAAKASSNIYRRFNGEIKQVQSSTLDLPLSGVGMAAIVESLTTLFENSWKYSGLGGAKYAIDIEVKTTSDANVLCFIVRNPLSEKRALELTPERLSEIKLKFQVNYDLESVASEGGSGFPKVARLSRYLDRKIFPDPLDISVEGLFFSVMAMVPIHLRGESYDIYNY